MTRVAVLPLDDRPVNYDYPVYLGRAAGLDVLLPPRDWLGNPWRESRHDGLIAWLREAAPRSDALIVAVDTLAYGGLIPSRRSPDSTDDVLARLAALREFKAINPQQPIFASSVILRISRANSSEEEKSYWATYGSRMFRLSYLEHKQQLHETSPQEDAERQALRESIPDDVYVDYLQGRARNHAVNRAMLDWLADGVFDYLIFPQDDTADYGWNIAEARALQAAIRTKGLTDRAITYPGADEIGCLLLAAYLCRSAGFRPRVWPRYSSVTSPAVITAYEDRPIQELIKAHLAPLNGTLAGAPEDADLLLFVNAPVFAQGVGELQLLVEEGVDYLRGQIAPQFRSYADALEADDSFRRTRREMQTPQRSPEEFVRALLVALGGTRPVALADVAFVNGADLLLGDQLVQHPEIVGLAAYGGWNTAGNTLGTVLAQAVIRTLALQAGPTLEQTAAHLAFLFLRFMDDYAYQARERTHLMVEDLPALGLAPTEERPDDPQLAAAVEARACERLLQASAAIQDVFVQSGQVQSVTLTNVYLPWQRLFEIGFDVTVIPTGANRT